MCTSPNHCKDINAGSSWLIPRNFAAKPIASIIYFVVVFNSFHYCTFFRLSLVFYPFYRIHVNSRREPQECVDQPTYLRQVLATFFILWTSFSLAIFFRPALNKVTHMHIYCNSLVIMTLIQSEVWACIKCSDLQGLWWSLAPAMCSLCQSFQ